MEREMHSHLIINGSGIASGGTYHKVKIRGDGTINGNLQCVQMKAFGNFDLSGNTVAKFVDIFGQSSMNGNFEAEKVKIFGQTDIRGDVLLKYVKLRGTSEIRGKLTGGEIHVLGELTVGQDCEADVFQVKGTAHIGGTLNAENIDIQLFGDSRVTELGGRTIRIKKGAIYRILDLLKLTSAHLVELSADSIEGDEIFLEHTKAKVVRGNHVVIGVGCEIDLVEYKTSFQQAKNAQVKESKQG